MGRKQSERCSLFTDYSALMFSLVTGQPESHALPEVPLTHRRPTPERQNVWKYIGNPEEIGAP